jgi:hypothetical protein
LVSGDLRVVIANQGDTDGAVFHGGVPALVD